MPTTGLRSTGSRRVRGSWGASVQEGGVPLVGLRHRPLVGQRTFRRSEQGGGGGVSPSVSRHQVMASGRRMGRSRRGPGVGVGGRSMPPQGEDVSPGVGTGLGVVLTVLLGRPQSERVAATLLAMGRQKARSEETGAAVPWAVRARGSDGLPASSPRAKARGAQARGVGGPRATVAPSSNARDAMVVVPLSLCAGVSLLVVGTAGIAALPRVARLVSLWFGVGLKL